MWINQNGTAFAGIDITFNAANTAISTDWAAINGGNVVKATYAVNTLGTGLNTDITANLTAATNTTASIRFNAAASILTLNTGAAPTTISTGGILVGVAAANTMLIVPNSLGVGALQSASNDFSLIAYTRNFFVAAPIQNFNGGSIPTNVTIGGNNTVLLTAPNTYTGTTTILSGATLSVDFSVAAAPTATIAEVGTTATVTTNTTMGYVVGQTITISNASVSGYNTTWNIALRSVHRARRLWVNRPE